MLMEHIIMVHTITELTIMDTNITMVTSNQKTILQTILFLDLAESKPDTKDMTMEDIVMDQEEAVVMDITTDTKRQISISELLLSTSLETCYNQSV
jgi:hypothetical protein